LSGGDTLQIGTGTYSENFTPPSGTLGAHTVIRSAPGATVTFAITNSLHGPDLYKTARQYIDFIGGCTTGINRTCNMIFDGTGSDTDLLSISDCDIVGSTCTVDNLGSHHITFDGVRFTKAGNGFVADGRMGVNTTYANNLTFKNCRFDNNGLDPRSPSSAFPGYGYYMSGGVNITVDNCEFDHNGGWGMHFYTAYSEPESSGNVFKNNIIHDNGQSPSSNQGTGGIIIGSGSSGTQAFNNIIYNNNLHESTSPGEGLRVAYGASGALIYSNTIYNNAIGLYTFNSSGMVAKNNIVTANTQSNILIDGSATGTSVSNNLCFGSGGTSNCQIIGSNPLFVDASGGDFHLVSGSGAIDAGANLGSPFNVDFAGVSRPQPPGGSWDAGAYEFQAGVVPPTPVVGLVLALGFNEGTGLPQDSSGYNNHVTSFQSGVTWQTTLCKYGNGCLSFNGNGGALVDDSPNLAAIYDSFTMEAWINPASAFNKFTSILDKVADPGPSGYLMLWAGTDSYFCPSTGPSGAFQSITGGSNPYVITCQNSVIAPGVWSHYAVTYDKTLANNNLKFYLNGTLIAQANSTETISATTGAALYIGSSIYTSSTYSEAFTGLMDDVRIYANVARTQAEIVADMNTPIAGGAAPAIPSSVKISSSSSIKLSPSSSVKVGVP